MPLSISERIKLHRKRKLRESRELLAEKTGIVFSEELTAEKDGFPVLKYLINALILFCADFGSLYCVISAFKINLSPGPLLVTCIVFSLILSFMYVRQRLKIIVYLSILAGFLTVIFRYYVLVNSGVNALWNSIIKYTDGMMRLPYLREFTVRYSDEYTAMSVAVCVIAVGLMILQNIMVSEKMSLRGLFFFTFPIAQLGMYFNFSSAKTGMFLVAVSWVLTEGIYLSGGYYGLTDKFVVSSSVKKHRHSYAFMTDAVNTSAIAAVWLAFLIAVTALVFSVVPDENFSFKLPLRDVKTESHRIAKNFMSYGVSAFFSEDRQANAPGKLSNTSSVSYDGLTDLEVDLVNYRVDRMYLRSFSGYYYDSKQMRWVNPPESIDYSAQSDITYRLLENDYASSQEVTKSRHRIAVKAVDPKVALGGLNVPYYTTLADMPSVKYTGPGSAESQAGRAGETVYYDVFTTDTGVIKDILPETDPEGKEGFAHESRALLSEMKAQAEKYALLVPGRNIPAIEEFCKEYSIKQTDSDTLKISKVLSAFRNDFEYSLRPGKVPQGEDYVNYFLTANRKGYCQHFATAAALIFRYLGIPARYAEGYAIDREDFYTSDILYDEDTAEWITSPYRVDSTVNRIYVPDSNGHAWVEIFVDGFGWDVAEVTAAVSREENRGFFSGLLGIGQTGENTGAADIINRMEMSSTGKRLALLGVIILLLFFIYYLVKMGVKVVPRHLSYAHGGTKKSLYHRYLHLNETCIYASGKSENLSYSELVSSYAADDTAFGNYEPGEFAALLEEALFAPGSKSEEEIRALEKVIASMKREKVKSLPFIKKTRYYFVDYMW